MSAPTSKTIEFDTRVGADGTLRIPPALAEQLPADAEVHVVVRRESSKEDQAEQLRRLLQTGERDDSLDAIFEQIDRELHAYHGRPVESLAPPPRDTLRAALGSLRDANRQAPSDEDVKFWLEKARLGKFWC